MRAAFPEMPSHWNSWTVRGRDIESQHAFASHYLNAARENPEGIRAMARDYSEFSLQYDLTDTLTYPDRVLAVDFLIKHYSAIYAEILFPRQKRIR